MYDRMVHSVTFMSLRRFGFPAEPLISMFTTLQELKQFIRTPAGDSVLFFDASHNILPHQSMGQGNGAGPTGWGAVSTPMLDMLRAKKLGTLFIGALMGDQL